MTMTVQQLIERLEKVEDKTKDVWTLNSVNELNMDIVIDEFTDSIEIYSKD